MGWKEFYRTKDFKANGKVLWVFSKGYYGEAPSILRTSSITGFCCFLPFCFLFFFFFFFWPDFLNWGEIPRVGHNWATELNWLTQKNYCFKPFLSVHLSGIKYTHIVAYPSTLSISRTLLSSQTESVPIKLWLPLPIPPGSGHPCSLSLSQATPGTSREWTHAVDVLLFGLLHFS